MEKPNELLVNRRRKASRQAEREARRLAKWRLDFASYTMDDDELNAIKARHTSRDDHLRELDSLIR